MYGKGVINIYEKLSSISMDYLYERRIRRIAINLDKYVRYSWHVCQSSKDMNAVWKVLFGVFMHALPVRYKFRFSVASTE